MIITNEHTYIESYKGVPVIVNVYIPEETLIKYLEISIIGLMNLTKENVNLILFGDKEYIKQLIEINQGECDYFDTLESDCNIYVFAELSNDKFHIIGIEDKLMNEGFEKMKIIQKIFNKINF